MDYYANNATDPFGMDGCIDFDHPANSGLPQDIWCEDCALRVIFEHSYADIMTRADFWTAAANAVILITSGGQLDLKDTFAFGRVDAESCPDSATRLPQDSSCNFVEDVFLNRMNMSWTNAVALLGAHTLGRGSIDFSGHDGIWVDTVDRSAVSCLDMYTRCSSSLTTWHITNHSFCSPVLSRYSINATMKRCYVVHGYRETWMITVSLRIGHGAIVMAQVAMAHHVLC